MRYKLRPGVVALKICGVYLLVPNRAASEFCPGVQKVSLLLYAALELLERGDPMEKIYKMYEILTKQTPDAVKARVDGLLSDLCSKGFLVPVGDAS